MGKGYKKYLALALSIALILESPMMSVKAAATDLDSNDIAIDTLAEDVEDSEVAEPVLEPEFEEEVDVIGDEDGLGEDQDKDLEDGLDDNLEGELEEELDENLDEVLEEDIEEDLVEDIEGEAKPMLRAGAAAEASEDFVIENGVLVKYNGKDEEVVIPDGVTEIGESAFEANSTLRSVKLPDSVKVIGFRAFYKCSKLEDVNLGKVEEIGEWAFCLCYSLKNIALPESVKAIGENTFESCGHLEHINLENVKKIGLKAFKNCYKLEDVDLSNVVEIGEWAFYMCSSFKNIELPDSLEKLGVGAFGGIAFIPKITIPKGTVCGEYVFDETIVRQLYFEDGREEIPERMLEYSTIEHIYVPSSVTSIGYIPAGAIIHGETSSVVHQYANEHNIRFFNSELTVLFGSPISIIDGGSSEGEFIWESDDETIATVDGNGVVTGVSNGTCTVNAKTSDGTVIGSCAVTVSDFLIKDGVLIKYNGTDEEVVIPDGVTEIGESAFEANSTLRSVKLPDSVKVIGFGAFSKCSKLEDVNLGKVEEIGKYAFLHCESLKKITIPKGTVCGEKVFRDSNIRQLYFEDGREEIPGRMLDDSTIEHIYVPSSVTSIGYIPAGAIIHGETSSVVNQYANEHNIRFFNSKLFIGTNSTISVIDGGASEGEFIWESDDETIATVDEKGAVYGRQLGSCNIYAKDSEGVVLGCCAVIISYEIENGVLVNYVGTTEDIVIPDGVVEIGSEVFANSRVKSIWLPESVKVIGKAAFYNCKNLEHINLENVVIVGEGAFYNCEKLEDVELGNTVEIGNLAFAKCKSLKNIELLGSLEKLGNGAFAGIDASMITIPKGIVCLDPAFQSSTIGQLYFEGGTTEIPQKMLDGAKIKHIYIPKEVTAIGNILKGAIVHGENGSFAQQYANEHDFRFFNNELSVENGSTISIINGGSSEGEFIWESDYEAIATVDAKGIVSGVSEGSCKISAKTADGTEIGFCLVSVSKKVRIVSVKELNISEIPTQEYIGGEIRPKPEVKDGETALEEGMHYTLSYASNTAVGKGYVTITGVPENGYEGSKKISFKIKAFDIAKNEGERFAISYEDTVEFSPAGAKPKVSISFNNADGTTKELKEGIDYTLSYKNSKSYGSKSIPTITVKAKGNYTGKTRLQFTLKERDISKANMIATDMIWRGLPNTYSTITVITDSGYILSEGIDYKIKYVYTEKTVVTVDGKKVTRRAGDGVRNNDVIPADTTLKVIATAKSRSGYTGSISATYKLYSIKSAIKAMFE